jgi:hypothetical protein
MQTYFHIFKWKLTLTELRLIVSEWLVEVNPFWAKQLLAYNFREKNKTLTDEEQKALFSSSKHTSQATSG